MVHAMRALMGGRLEEAELAPKATADGHGVHRHLVIRQPQYPRDQSASVKERLGRRVHRQVAKRVDRRHARLRE